MLEQIKVVLLMAALVTVVTSALAAEPDFPTRRRALAEEITAERSAAPLAELVDRVYTIEIVEPLALEARERLSRLGYRNVEVRAGDGYKGWEERAPFDAIMVTAGAEEVPPPLIRQLKPGGRMVIPVGPAQSIQHLTLVEKQADGSIRTRQVAPVRFVPFTRRP